MTKRAPCGGICGDLSFSTALVILLIGMTERAPDSDPSTLKALQRLLSEPEGERLEFKAARSSFQFDHLGKYSSALANEGGGKIVLGVTDLRPRDVVGTTAFPEPGKVVSSLMEKLHHRLRAHEVAHPSGRVLIFEVDPRYPAAPVAYEGIYYARAGESLTTLGPADLKRIFEEGGLDFSSELHPAVTLNDLDLSLIDKFREMWVRKTGNGQLAALTVDQLLRDAELMVEDRITSAALILLGRREAVSKYLPQAEVVFEYRSSEASLGFQQRKELRVGFLGALEELWETINLRNEVIEYREGLFVGQVRVFNDAVVREALLNAFTHRDYRLPGSIFVRQFPRKLEIISPGGFPAGITRENLLWRQLPRNRRIAESCTKCGLVERSGQGANRMFEESIKEAKPTPTFDGTDEYQVCLTLHGEVQNPDFLRFLQQVGVERLATFTTHDLLVLNALQRNETVPEDLKSRIPGLVEQGVIERIGRGKGGRVILSRRFYAFLGKGGAYTRTRGLDHETNKALLVKHIQGNTEAGAAMKEFQQVLPACSRKQILRLLQELKSEGKAHSSGHTRASRWFIRLDVEIETNETIETN
jgi:ATP-dependent DNA helicase RecG